MLLLEERTVSPQIIFVFPIDWKNGRGRQVLVRDLKLVVTELETGKEQKFILAGEYPEISNEGFENHYAYKNSFSLDPNSVSQRVLIFHTEYWWDSDGEYSDDDYTFRFASGQRHQVRVEFLMDAGEYPHRTTVSDGLTIYPAADEIPDWEWDHFRT